MRASVYQRMGVGYRYGMCRTKSAPDLAQDTGAFLDGVLPLDALPNHAAPEETDRERYGSQTLSRDFGDRHRWFLLGPSISNPDTRVTPS